MTVDIALKIKKFFLANIKVKILCLLIAIVLWVFVASNQSLLGKYPNKIPIKVANLSSQYQSFLDQSDVQIYVMADSSVWRTLSVDSFVASVDLAGYKDGTYELDVRVVSNVANVQITKIDPVRVFVSVEKIETKNLSVSAKIDGDPGDGMAVGQIEIEPQEVIISGPNSYLDTVSEAIATIKLNGETASFERDIKISALGENSKELTGVTFSPDSVKTKVSIIKGGNNKTVGVKVKTRGSPKDGYYISKISVTPAAVDISGQRSILANINYLETEEIDIGNIADNITKDVNLILPEGVSLQKNVLQKVRSEIYFSEIATVKAVVPSVVSLGLDNGLKLASFTPTDIKVYISGPMSVLNTLDASNVRVELNLAGKIAGNYNVDINPSMVKLPNGIAVSSVFPSQLSIIVTN